MKVRIETGANPFDTRITNVETGENFDRCYGFHASQTDPTETTRITLFCFADDGNRIEGEADVIQVHPSLKQRARELAERIGRPEVTAAFSELLGAPIGK